MAKVPVRVLSPFPGAATYKLDGLHRWLVLCKPSVVWHEKKCVSTRNVRAALLRTFSVDSVYGFVQDSTDLVAPSRPSRNKNTYSVYRDPPFDRDSTEHA